jgi:hypothetical protein
LWSIRATHLALSGALLVGATGGSVALVTAARGTPPPLTAEAVLAEIEVEPAPDLGAAGFAELYVSTWLTAGRDSEDLLTSFTAQRIDLHQVTSGGYWSAKTVVVDLTEVTENYWSVLVAAEVLARSDDDTTAAEYRNTGIRYYTVGVVHHDTGFVVTSLPAQVSPPTTLNPPALAVDNLEASTASSDLAEVADTMTGFVQAFLAGTGDLDRYLAPGTALVPISPAPFTTAEITALGTAPSPEDPDGVLARVEVLATDNAGNSQALEYSAVLATRDDRWEVTGLVPAAPLAAVTPDSEGARS